MANIKFDKERILTLVATYFFEHGEEECTSLSMEKLYEKIVEYASINEKKLKMPSFAQMRNFIIEELTEAKLYNEREKLTSKVAYRILESFYDETDVEDLLEAEYNVSIYNGPTIVCTINLPPIDILDPIAVGFSKKEKKSKIYGRMNLIRRLCRSIKKTNPELILAVIPESNRVIHLNADGKIDREMASLNPICDTLCMFVKDGEEGRKLINEFKIAQFLTENSIETI